MLLFHKSSCDWLLAGLGNPGAQYEKTRHNTGFQALSELAGTLNVSLNREKFQARYALADYRGQKLLLLEPHTYMNASGLAVRQAADYYHIPPERILVLFDDISLPVGRIRVRHEGSAGGHNGIKSIISTLGTDAFPRVKIGVGAKPHPDYDLADWVLSQLSKEELPLYRDAVSRAAEAALFIVENGCEKAAARYNGK